MIIYYYYTGLHFSFGSFIVPFPGIHFLKQFDDIPVYDSNTVPVLSFNSTSIYGKLG